MARYLVWLQRKVLRFSWLAGVSLLAILVLNACYQEVVVTSSPTAEVIEAADAQPTQAPAQPPEQPAGNDSPPPVGGGGGGASPEPREKASPTVVCGPSPTGTSAPGVTPLPTCTSSSRPPAVNTPIPGAQTAAAGTRTPVGSTRPGVTPPATVRGGTVPTVRPGTTMPAGGQTTVPTVMSGPTIPGITVSAGTTFESSVSPSESTDQGTLLVTKHENFANEIIPGACFALLTGETVVATACDQGDGDLSPEPGVIGLAAPVGTYALRETAPPDGYEPGADVEVVLAAGTPTAIDVINHLVKTTDTLTINKVDPSGTPLAGVCFDIAGADGSLTNVCDGGPNDASADSGVIQIEVNAGDYVLRETPLAGYLPTEVAVSVNRGAGATVQVMNTLATPSEEPSTGVGVFVASNVGPDGSSPFAGICLTLTGPATYTVCDNGEGDVDPTEGTIEIDDVTAGDYTLTSSLPDGLTVSTALPAVTVIEAEIAQVTLQFQPADTATTETTATPDGVVIVQSVMEDGVTPLSGVCLTLRGPVELTVCDNGESDPEPTEGVIELDTVPAGDYAVELVVPEGFELAMETPTLRVQGGEVAPLNLVFRATQTVPEEGVVVILSSLDDGATIVPGVCISLTGPMTVVACDSEEDDSDPTEGVIELQAVQVGAYSFEIGVPDGYELLPEVPSTLQVDAGVATSVMLAFRQIVAVGSIQINKVDATDGVTLLGGACFEVTGSIGTFFICDNDENDLDETVGDDAAAGVILFAGLPIGDYTIHETQAPNGYEPAADQTAVVEQDLNSVIVIADIPVPPPATGSLLVVITDQSDNPLTGSCLSLQPQFGDGGVATVDLCDGGDGEGEADGAILFSEIQPGLYQLVEMAPPTGYRTAEPVSIEIPAEGGESSYSLPHELLLGSLSITTTGPDEIPVPNACFTLIASDGTSTDRCDDDAVGVVSFDGLPAGDYIVRLMSLPTDFSPGEVSEQVATVVADERASLIFAVVRTAPTTVSMLIIVTDDLGKPLPGTCFDLAGPQSARACDDVENDADPNPGSILIHSLAPGEYAVVQSQTPVDYLSADPQTATLDLANAVATIAVINMQQPSGIALGVPVMYTDDAGRLWLLRPDDTQPIRLDSNERPYVQRIAPISSFDHVEVAFLVNNPDQPGANMVWVNVQDQALGSIDFSSIGLPTQIAWVPGRHDVLIVGVQQPSGTANVYYFNIETSEVTGPIFPAEGEPVTIDGIHPSPATTLVALQTTRGDGNPDTWLIDTQDPASPILTNVAPNDGLDADYFAGWSPAGDTLLVRSGVDAAVFYVTSFNRVTTAIHPEPMYLGDPNFGTAPAWSPDSSLVSFFDNVPGAGGRLHIARTDGSPLCEPISDVETAAWSPDDARLWILMNVPGSPQLLAVIGTDCSVQQMTSFDVPVSRLAWAPNGRALALVTFGDGEASLSTLVGDAIIPTDMSGANVAFADILSWSPGGDVLAIYAGGPSVSIWVVTAGSNSPVIVAGSTVPEGANYITRVWWP